MTNGPRPGPLRVAGSTSLALLTGLSHTASLAQDRLERPAGTIVVTAPGGAFNRDDAITLDRQDIARSGQPDLLGALVRNVAGVSLQDAQNNPWQPNLIYRGYVASPLQGQAQGLAAYLDGGRFNQPFGDTVGFDLIPDAALRSASLMDANAVYGLNALGGTLLLETATGRSDPGYTATAVAGSYGQREVSLSGGGARGEFSHFAALQYRREDGWRDFSPSELFNLYADIGLDGEAAGLHAKLIAADTDLTGNGVAPVELLAARRQAVFSWPDNSRSRYGRVSLHPWFRLSEATRIEATLYRQRLRASSFNGDVADIEECDDDDEAGLLCLETAGDDADEESEQVLTDDSGAPVPALLGDDEPYGVLNRGRVHTRSKGVLAQVIDERALHGGTNRLAVGFSSDDSHTDFTTSTELGALTEERSVEGLGPLIVQADGSIAPVSLAAETRYWGLFLAETLPLGEALTAEIGLRQNWAEIRLVDRIGTALNGRHSFARFNPGLELRWQVSPGAALRAGYAESNRAPTPAELSCADEDAPCSLANFFVADPPLRQVVARHWELGASGRATTGAWQVEWLLSGFRATNSDDIQHVASDIRGRAFFRNVGRTRRQGVELSAQARRGGLTVGAGYAFTDAVFRSSLLINSPSNPEADDDGTIAVSPGDRLPGIPRHSATLSVDYGETIGGTRLALGFDLLARSSQRLIGDEAGLNDPVPGYLLANLRARIEPVAGLALFGEVTNLFDRDHATFGTFTEVDEVELEEVPGASDPRAYGPGAPRRWSVGLEFAF